MRKPCLGGQRLDEAAPGVPARLEGGLCIHIWRPQRAVCEVVVCVRQIPDQQHHLRARSHSPLTPCILHTVNSLGTLDHLRLRVPTLPSLIRPSASGSRLYQRCNSGAPRPGRMS